MDVKIIFLPKSTKNKNEIIKEIDSAYKLVFSFFNQKISEIDINVVNNRKEFDFC